MSRSPCAQSERFHRVRIAFLRSLITQMSFPRPCRPGRLAKLPAPQFRQAQLPHQV
jgi:hypothetical protein